MLWVYLGLSFRYVPGHKKTHLNYRWAKCILGIISIGEKVRCSAHNIVRRGAYNRPSGRKMLIGWHETLTDSFERFCG
jgi:hypothetical protein